jgi:hypothetical protein
MASVAIEFSAPKALTAQKTDLFDSQDQKSLPFTMSAAASAASAASASLAGLSLTVRLLTGEILLVPLTEHMTCMSFYDAVYERLDEDIRPDLEMEWTMLLLRIRERDGDGDGEPLPRQYVPLDHQDGDTYALLIETPRTFSVRLCHVAEAFNAVTYPAHRYDLISFDVFEESGGEDDGRQDPLYGGGLLIDTDGHERIHVFGDMPYEWSGRYEEDIVFRAEEEVFRPTAMTFPQLRRFLDTDLSSTPLPPHLSPLSICSRWRILDLFQEEWYRLVSHGYIAFAPVPLS